MRTLLILLTAVAVGTLQGCYTQLAVQPDMATDEVQPCLPAPPPPEPYYPHPIFVVLPTAVQSMPDTHRDSGTQREEKRTNPPAEKNRSNSPPRTGTR